MRLHQPYILPRIRVRRVRIFPAAKWHRRSFLFYLTSYLHVQDWPTLKTDPRPSLTRLASIAPSLMLMSLDFLSSSHHSPAVPPPPPCCRRYPNANFQSFRPQFGPFLWQHPCILYIYGY
ncbi:hypothetical protein BDZ89DRAFT_687116 [Hymenopellis radicata]|nr:hypothetical protein BDZ89DRAFT_687116 [Hymenopellis radicata]